MLVYLLTINSFLQVLVKEVDNTGKTALHYCAENSDTACAKLLLSLDEGIINRQDLEGYTALLLAVIAGNQGMIKFLLAHGAKVNITDNEKHTAVHWATGRSWLYSSTVFFRLRAHAQISAQGLFFTVRRGMTSVNVTKNL